MYKPYRIKDVLPRLTGCNWGIRNFEVLEYGSESKVVFTSWLGDESTRVFFPDGTIYVWDERNAMTTATWNISLDCECPHCNEEVDLLDGPDFWDGRLLDLGEHGTSRSKDVEVYCPKCGKEFHVELEY